MPRRPRTDEAGDLEIEEGLVESPVLDAGDLDLEDPDFPDISWTVKRVLTPEQMQSMGTRESESFVTKFRGPLDLATIQQQLGGGRFHFYGKVGREMAKNRIITIEGEYRQVRIAPPIPNGNASLLAPNVTQLSVATAPSAAEERAARLLRRLRRERRQHAEEQRAREARERDEKFEKILQAIASRPAAEGPKPPGINDLVQAVAGIHAISGGNVERESDAEKFKTLFGVLNQGITIGQEREPIRSDGTDPNPWGPTVEKIAEILARVLANRQPPMRPPGPTSPGQARPSRSTATVIEEPPRPAAAAATSPDPTDSSHRWLTATEMVYRNMVNGRDPIGTADALSEMLDETELAPMLDPNVTADHVNAYLASRLPGFAEKFPGLEKPQGKVYLTSVLAALRDTDDEATPAE